MQGIGLNDESREEFRARTNTTKRSERKTSRFAKPTAGTTSSGVAKR